MIKRFLIITTLVLITFSGLFSLPSAHGSPGVGMHDANPAATAPVANFSANPTSGLPPLQVQFTDESAGTPTGWAWYFGDEAFDEPWTQMTTAIEWTARSGHTSVALPDGSIVLMGGWDATGLRNDVWRSTDHGVTWTQMTAAAPWTGRRYHTSVALSDGSIVLMGGEDSLTAFDCRRDDVWRSTDQGATWTMMTNAAEWGFRSEHSSVVVPSNEGDEDSILLMGGLVQLYLGGVMHISSSVWRSTDQGATWTQIMAVGDKWSARYGHASVALPDGSIVLMGGSFNNDVWRSTDQGVTWTQMTAAASWTGRRYHTSVALSDGSIVLMGGFDGSNYLNDVWRSTDQGATWTELTAAAEWSERSRHTSVVLLDGSIVIVGGWDITGRRNDVWRSTNLGANWISYIYSARTGHTSVALPDGSIVLMGGRDITGRRNDVWRSTDGGATWTPMTAAAPWTAREYHTSVVLPDGSIVLMGGWDGSNSLNDVWRSTDQGATWTELTAAAEWMARYGHTSVVLPDGSIVLIGGTYYDGGDVYLNDVWRSTDQGTTWMQLSAAAEWMARYNHTSVTLPDSSIVLMGGICYPVFDEIPMNDVWRSTDQGATWTQLTAAAEWTARNDHTSVALPDGSIVLMGGWDTTGRRNDVWRSTDQGVTWTQVTATAEWMVRCDHTSVVLPDGVIVLMGGKDFIHSYKNDVWQLETAGSNDQNPSHVYTEKGIYSVVLQIYNTDGFSSKIKRAYINTTGSIPEPDPDGLKLFLPLILH